jgi:hypothetical protein
MTCTKMVNHSKIKVEENKRKAIFNNPLNELYEVSIVDGCLVKEGIRCDSLVTKKDCLSVLIELKGTNVQHACNQLFAAVSHPNVNPLIDKKVGFLVICSKYPKFDTFVRKAKDRAAKQFRSGFHVVCNQGTFDIENVVKISGPN